MRVAGEHYRSVWIDEPTGLPRIIDQTLLPHRFETRLLESPEAAAEAIRTMRVRGAPLIGATAAHGLALALARDGSDDALSQAGQMLVGTRPTAVNLRWAVDRMRRVVAPLAPGDRAARAREEAIAICDEDVAACSAIGDNGHALLQELVRSRDRDGRPVSPDAPLQLLTHCNAGWLATVDWGTALAPIYKAHDAGLPVHVWVDETRPRNQGASLTAFELREHGVPHTVIVDNAGGHLMQRGLVDAVLVGSDRTTATGDVCNKIGTYLKALAAQDNGVPFYVALPRSTIDWTIEDGFAGIPIEERAPDEVREIEGEVLAGGEGGEGGERELGESGANGGGDDRPRSALARVRLFSEASPVANPAFDVTPARYVTALVTEVGVAPATREGLAALRAKAPTPHSP